MCTSCRSPLVFDVPSGKVFISCYACESRMLIEALPREQDQEDSDQEGEMTSEPDTSPDGTPHQSPALQAARAATKPVEWRFPPQDRDIGRRIDMPVRRQLAAEPNPMLASVQQAPAPPPEGPRRSVRLPGENTFVP